MYLGLSWYWRHSADLAAFDGINDTALADIRVSNQSDRYLLLVRMQLRELAEELNKGALAKRVVRRGVEGECRIARREVLDIACGDPVWNQVALVEDEEDLLVGLLLADELQNALAKCTHGITGVEHVKDNVRGVNDLIQLAINTARGTLGVDGLNDVGICGELDI